MKVSIQCPCCGPYPGEVEVVLGEFPDFRPAMAKHAEDPNHIYLHALRRVYNEATTIKTY